MAREICVPTLFLALILIKTLVFGDGNISTLLMVKIGTIFSYLIIFRVYNIKLIMLVNTVN